MRVNTDGLIALAILIGCAIWLAITLWLAVLYVY